MLPLLHIGVGGPAWLGWISLEGLLLVIVLEWGYLYAIHDLRPRISDAGRVRRSQQLLFHAGAATVLFAAASPLHYVGEQYWLSAHMTQHLLLTLVAPPLLLAGIPGWLWQWPLRNPQVFYVARWLTRPVLAFALFNTVQVLTHLPPMVELSLENGAFHFAVHGTLVVTAMLMWWPILSSVPELPRLSYPLQMAYLFLQSLLPAVIVGFVTFADSVVYDFYADAPRLLGVSALEDQQLAGGIMKLAGSIILWSFIGVAFFKWYQHDQAQEAEPSWPEIEQELEELGLTRK